MSEKAAVPAATLEIGAIVRPHGVHGAVKVRLHNPTSEALSAAMSIILRHGAGEEGRTHQATPLGRAGKFVVLELSGVSTREQAEELRGARVCVLRESIEAPADGEYLYADLIGCRVEGTAGAALGQVYRLFDAGASDVLVIRDADRERYLPFTDDWVVRVDLAARCITVQGEDQFESWPIAPGL